MPWKESPVMEERLRFVAQLLEGESMTALCRQFGISRNTGYKLFDRYKEHGLRALTDRSRRPVHYANQLPQQLEAPPVGQQLSPLTKASAPNRCLLGRLQFG